MHSLAGLEQQLLQELGDVGTAEQRLGFARLASYVAERPAAFIEDARDDDYYLDLSNRIAGRVHALLGDLDELQRVHETHQGTKAVAALRSFADRLAREVADITPPESGTRRGPTPGDDRRRPLHHSLVWQLAIVWRHQFGADPKQSRSAADPFVRVAILVAGPARVDLSGDGSDPCLAVRDALRAWVAAGAPDRHTPWRMRGRNTLENG
jgi:hypothetical protein